MSYIYLYIFYFTSRKLVLDAFARIGTEDAGEVIQSLVAKGKLNKHLERVMVGLGWTRFSKISYISKVMVSLEIYTFESFSYICLE